MAANHFVEADEADQEYNTEVRSGGDHHLVGRLTGGDLGVLQLQQTDEVDAGATPHTH